MVSTVNQHMVYYFSVEENGFGASAYAVHWDPDHSPSSKYLCYLNQVAKVLVVNELIVCYFLQKKMVLMQVLMRYIGIQIMLLLVSTSTSFTKLRLGEA